MSEGTTPFYWPFECMWCDKVSDPADDMQTALNKGWRYQSGGKRVFCSTKCSGKWWDEENQRDEEFWARMAVLDAKEREENENAVL